MLVVDVAVLALDDVVPFDLGVPGQVFGAPVLGGRYRVAVCVSGGGVRTCDGPELRTASGPELLDRAGLVVLPGTDPPVTGVPSDVVTALRAAHARGVRLVGLGTGAFVLAAAGLLDGRAATTRARYAGELAARHPGVDLRPDAPFVVDAAVLTSAGPAAGIDLCLHVVGTDHGDGAATACARYLGVEPDRRTGPGSSAGPLADTLAWLTDTLHRDTTLDEMAAHAAMSRRTLTRAFRRETGTTPLQWLLAARIRLARRLLETTDRSVDDIAAACGLRTGPVLRRHLRAVTGSTPAAYRKAARRPTLEG